jgi:haloacetate dehalogenase
VFSGFERARVDTGEATINVVHGGSGPPVLLLHGFPQTSAMWAGIAPQLAETHTVVATDLRGYGSSSIPESGDDHAGYSFRAMAADQVAVLAALGHERFAVVGHDRGARVSYRLALDHPERVTRLAVLDILPTDYVYDHVDRALATAYYHWFLFIQPADLPERLIAGDPSGYLLALLGAWGGSLDHVSAEALASYEKAFTDPDRRHAMLEDYRAGASIDLEHDAADRGRRIDVPLLALWGRSSVVGRNPVDPLDVWRERGGDVHGATVPAGHFLVEESPEETLRILRDFLAP